MRPCALAAAVLLLPGGSPARAAGSVERSIPTQAPNVVPALPSVSAEAASDLVVDPTLGAIFPNVEFVNHADAGEAALGGTPGETARAAEIPAEAPGVFSQSVEFGPPGKGKVFQVTVRIEEVGPGWPARSGAEGRQLETVEQYEQPPVRGQLALSAASLGPDAVDPAGTLLGLFEDAGGRPIADHARLVVGGGRAEGFKPLLANEISLNPDPAAKPHVLGVIERAPFPDRAFEAVVYRGGVDVTPRGLRETSRLLSLGGRLVFDTGPAESVRIRYLIPVLLHASFAPGAVALDMWRRQLLLEAVKIGDAAFVKKGVFTFPNLFRELVASDLRLKRMMAPIAAMLPPLDPRNYTYLAAMLTSGIADWSLIVSPELERPMRAVLASPRVRRAAPRRDHWAPPRLSVGG